jgi:hypothetical protein
LKNAKDHFDDVEKKAKAAYDAYPDPKAPFERWVISNYPSYGIARAALQAAQGARDAAYNKYKGRLDDLHKAQDKLTKALDTQVAHPPYVNRFISCVLPRPFTL